MQPVNRRSLKALCLASVPSARWLDDGERRVTLDRLEHGSALRCPAEALRGLSVLVLAETQLPAVLAAIELDGVARRIVLCLPDMAASHLPSVVAGAQVDVVVTDGTGPSLDTIPHIRVVPCSIDLTETTPVPRDVETEWVLFTSGTTGQPKMVLHTLPSLSGPLDDGVAVPDGAVWSTFYDVRRYGGLQMLLRALLGGGSILLTDARQPVATLLERAGAAGVTHISGTPSHWRRALMSPAAHRMAPAYVRLSGEIADQAILDSLREAYPDAGIAHAFASTEAGVAFDVRDGLAGFPAALLDSPGAKAEMRVEDGTLRIRSTRTAARYLDDAAEQLREPGGFVDTGDMVERRGDRCHFIGRRGGVINVGGLKVFPEEVEAVINRHPCVRMSRVWARKSPITGAVVAAEIVLRQAADDAGPGFPTIRDEIVQACRTALPVHKVPVSLRSVASLEIAASGKLVRHHA
jgi:acyl-coenzyme A synthetase/AMP-(fatty) acid ligase